MKGPVSCCVCVQCNNPLTKEPKLQAAMRIVPEWKNYDYEIKVLWDQIYNTNTKDQIQYDPPDITLPGMYLCLDKLMSALHCH